jgi:hypothetical protein
MQHPLRGDLGRSPLVARLVFALAVGVLPACSSGTMPGDTGGGSDAPPVDVAVDTTIRDSQGDVPPGTDAPPGTDVPVPTDGPVPTDAISSDAVPRDTGRPDATTSCDGVGVRCDGGGTCATGLNCYASSRGAVCGVMRPICGGFAGAVCSAAAPNCLHFMGTDYGACATDSERDCICATSRSLIDSGCR